MKNKTAEKIKGQCFPIKSRITCKNLAHLKVKKKKKKKRPKKSLMLFMQATLQFSRQALLLHVMLENFEIFISVQGW